MAVDEKSKRTLKTEKPLRIDVNRHNLFQRVSAERTTPSQPRFPVRRRSGCNGKTYLAKNKKSAMMEKGKIYE